MFTFTFVFSIYLVTMTINSKAQTWDMYVESLLDNTPNAHVWDWESFLPIFQMEMEKRGMAPEVISWNNKTYLKKWEDHFFDESGKYTHSIASGYFDFVDELAEEYDIVLPKRESTAPARKSWNWWNGTSAQIRDHKRRVRRYNRMIK